APEQHEGFPMLTGAWHGIQPCGNGTGRGPVDIGGPGEVDAQLPCPCSSARHSVTVCRSAAGEKYNAFGEVGNCGTFLASLIRKGTNTSIYCFRGPTGNGRQSESSLNQHAQQPCRIAPWQPGCADSSAGHARH